MKILEINTERTWRGGERQPIALREELTEKAYREVKYLYSIERMTEDYLKIFELILKGASPL